MVGGGNANVYKAIPYKTDLWTWHYIYFGYSKLEKLAFASVEFSSGI
jgi:hypothetical protein